MLAITFRASQHHGEYKEMACSLPDGGHAILAARQNYAHHLAFEAEIQGFGNAYFRGYRTW